MNGRALNLGSYRTEFDDLILGVCSKNCEAKLILVHI
jgi:hypothetical protein